MSSYLNVYYVEIPSLFMFFTFKISARVIGN